MSIAIGAVVAALGLGTVILLLVAFALLWIAYIVYYLLWGFEIKKIVEERGICKNAWYIPIAFVYPLLYNLWIGKIADDYNAKSLNKQTKHYKIQFWAVLISAIGFVLSWILCVASYILMLIPYVGPIISFILSITALIVCVPYVAAVILSLVYLYISLYTLFDAYSPDNKVLFLVLSIVTQLSGIFMIISHRKAKAVAAEPDAAPVFEEAVAEEPVAEEPACIPAE